MDIVCKKSQSTTNLRKMICIATWPRKILQLWLWWTPRRLQLKRPVPHALNNGSKAGRSKFLEFSSENSKESLLVGSKFSTNGKLGCSVRTPEHVPKGFLGVYVGAEQRRFVIPLSCLSMPEFRGLMDKVAEEFGYDHQEGGIHIPCEEEIFEEILQRCLRYIASKSNIKRNNK
ncbi:unnamed protein product [Dovyalis caffra]|uniref:Small auxin up regulated protein n=1 Tax=Dovyalis caffra TaxID=77055 RepID=A0AAV1QSI6_9ROSI|nr:unnamed protein product [Dovyalis caffra]